MPILYADFLSIYQRGWRPESCSTPSSIHHFDNCVLHAKWSDDAINRLVPWFVISGIFIVIGGALMFTVDITTSAGKVYRYSVLIGIGTGLACQASYSVAPVKVAMNPRYGPQMVPDAIGFINMAQIGCVVHALAISGTVFQNLAFKTLKNALAGRGFTDSQLHSAISGAQSGVPANASEDIKALAVGAIIKAMDRVYILVIVAGGVAFLASLTMKWEKLFMKMSAGGA
ncbi:hypothetical protein F5884DRAFT_780928 [Xylogone sp. PMI_703]|nr:hypothetical protein F5884DRAFT_780928 [Xylogone sp. PMI_703]